jgi:hypothetical protein
LTLTRFSTEEITDTTTLEAETNDIYELHGKDLSYPTARTVLYETKNVEYSTCGQHYYNYYNVYRTALLFNLNSIGGYEILSATLKLTGYNDWSSDRDFNMQARGFTEDTLASNNASFIGYGNTSFGSINTLDYSGNADGMTISFNSSGLSYLTNKISSDCVIMLISDDDINAIAPSSAYENLGIYSAGASTPAYRPHLEITYRGVPPLKMAVSAAATKFATIFKIAATDVITGASTVFWRTVVIMENVGIAVSSTGSRALTLARTASAGVAAAISTGWTYGIYLLVRLGIYDYAHSRPAILRSNVFVKAVTTAYHKMISKIFRGNI